MKPIDMLPKEIVDGARSRWATGVTAFRVGIISGELGYSIDINPYPTIGRNRRLFSDGFEHGLRNQKRLGAGE